MMRATGGSQATAQRAAAATVLVYELAQPTKLGRAREWFDVEVEASYVIAVRGRR